MKDETTSTNGDDYPPTVGLKLSNGTRLTLRCVKNESGKWERKDKYLERTQKHLNHSNEPVDKDNPPG
jgi:hypothetical protein